MSENTEIIQGESWHYTRTCESCGCIWAGLHCPHDGHQNSCPECSVTPSVVQGDCECEFDWEDDEEYVAKQEKV